jgi:uncharacterized repeat protein (TIGR01451 family)
VKPLTYVEPLARAQRIIRIAMLLSLLCSYVTPLTPVPLASAAQDTAQATQSASDIEFIKTDSLLTDQDGDGKADPGDTIRYTVELNNTGSSDLQSVVISDTLDANTSLVAGSAQISALALDDHFVASLNTPLTIVAPGVLANDIGTPAATVTVFSGATAQGGTVTIAANGGFSYTPASGFDGIDSFEYTISNALGSDTAQVTIEIEAAPRVVSTMPADAATFVPANSTVSIVFSEPVILAANAVTAACPSGTPISLTNLTGNGPATTFEFEAAGGSFPSTVTCTITVAANAVSDADTLDPPDNLASDYQFSFTTTDTMPEVVSTTPLSGTMHVDTTADLVVEFNEDVNVTNDAFVLECPVGTSISLGVSGGPSTYTLSPSGALPAGVVCELTIVASEVSDVDTIDPPDTLAEDVLVRFETEAPPEVLSTIPADAASDLASNTNITVIFNEPVTVGADAFALECTSSTSYPLVNTTGSGPATTFVLSPTSLLPNGASCDFIVLAVEVSDADNTDPPDTMLADYSISFSIDAAPTVTSTSPSDTASDVPTDSAITIIFSESVNASTASFEIECPTGTNIPFSLSASPATSFTLTPNALLPAGESCSVTVVAAEISDADTADPPDTMTADYSFGFTTDAAPEVVSTTPSDNATGIASNTTITVEFSEPVSATASSFALVCPSTIPVTVAAGAGNSYVLTPSSALPAGATCEVTVIASQISDTDTNDQPDGMLADYSFNFTIDEAPTVESTIPSDGATGLPSDGTITITFSEPVNAAAMSFELACPSDTTHPFTLAAGAGNSYVLTPSTALPNGTTCQVRVISNLISDVDMADPPDVMEADYVFSFSTDAAPEVVSTVPSDLATGVAINTSITINFSEPVNYNAGSFDLVCTSPQGFSVSALSGSSATITPSDPLPEGTNCTVRVFATLISDVDTNDPPDTMLADYVFSFTTDAAPAVSSITPANNATDVASDTNIVVTFSEQVNVTANAFTLQCPTGTAIPFANSTGSGPSTSFVLVPDSDLPSNTSCQVQVIASEVSDADSADPPDTMLADFSASFTTDAAPSVTSTSPAQNDVDVLPNATITVNFSESVNLTSNAFGLVCAASNVPITVSASPASSFTITPDNMLPINSTCTLTVLASEVSDVDTNDPPDNMEADYTLQFVVINEDIPEVISHTPSNGATDLSTTTSISITFSEPVNVTANAFELACPSGTPIPFTNSTGLGPATSFTLTPNANLPAGETCTVIVRAAEVSDADTIDPPDTMLTNYSFSFTTDAAPRVTNHTPSNGATNQGTDRTITIVFSEAVNYSTASFSLDCDGAQTFTVAGTSGTNATLTPTSNLPAGKTCTVTVIAANITDVDTADPPDTMVADYSFSFSTDAQPSVTSTSPAQSAVVANNASITINFSEAVNVTNSAFTLACPSDTPIPFTNSTGLGPATSFVLVPSVALPNGASCQVQVIASEVSDADTVDPPDGMAANYTLNFMVDAQPTITSTTPISGTLGVPINSTIIVNFSESVTFNTTSFSLQCPTGSAIPFTLSASPATSATINPIPPLPYATVCTLTVIAANVRDADTIDPPDTLAANYTLSFSTPLLAADDTYTAPIIGNTSINTALSSNFSVLTNDIPSTATISAYDTSSAQGGTVSMNTSTGTFSYTPAPGYRGNDSFTYTISNELGSATATVNLSVVTPVWFLNTNAAAGNGTLAAPFNSVSALDSAATQAGDRIFIYESATPINGSLTLKNNQIVVGQDSTGSLATALNLSFPSDTVSLPSLNAANSTYVQLASTGTTVTLAQNNTIRGVRFGDSTIDLAGNNFGTATLDDVQFLGTGQALALSNGTLQAVISQLTSLSGTNNVALSNVNGSLTATTGTLNGATGTSVLLSGGNISFSYGGNITKTSAGLLLSMQNRTANAVTLSGTLNCTTNCTGLRIQNNLGSIAITGSSNLVSVMNNLAIVIENTTISASGVRFLNVTVTGGTNAIVLTNTGAGSFRIDGDGGTASNASGGIISNTTGPAILLNTTGPVSLHAMVVQNGQDDGIRGINTSGFTLSYSTIRNNGNSTTSDSLTALESGIELQNALGNVSIQNSTIQNSSSHNVHIQNTSGTLNNLTVSNSTFNTTNATFGGDGFFVNLPPGSNATIQNMSVTGSSFLNNRSDGIQVNAEGTSSVNSFVFSNNTVTNNNAMGINVSTNGTARINFDINNNVLVNRGGINIAANDGVAQAGGGPVMEGYIRNNPQIEASTLGSAYHGVNVMSNGDGRIVVDISGNTVSNYGLAGFAIQVGDGTGQIHARLANNQANTTATEPLAAAYLRSGSGAPGETTLLCANIAGNTFGTHPMHSGLYYFDRLSPATTTFQIQGLTPPSANEIQTLAFIQGYQAGATNYVEAGTYTNATCQSPSFSLLAADGEGPGAPSISQAQLDNIAQAASARWSQAGLSPDQLAQLQAAQVRVADLPDGQLGNSGAGKIEIDQNAAGWGWFVDSTPGDDSEFSLQAGQLQASNTNAQNRVDLLTSVLHEQGHLLGLHEENPNSPSLMAAELPLSVRRLPVTQNAPSALAIGANSIELSIDSLPAGKRIVLVFDVVVGDDLPNNISQVSNQASLSANGIGPILSDDPDTTSLGDATITQLDRLKLLYLPYIQTAGSADLVVESIRLVPNKTSFNTSEAVEIEVVVRNQGNANAAAFWVDLYINPSSTPSFNQPWQNLCSLDPCYGMAWSVAQGLAAGQSITLRSSDLPTGYSNWPGSFAPGTTTLYALADSWNASGMIDTQRANNLRQLSGLQVNGKARISTKPSILPR